MNAATATSREQLVHALRRQLRHAEEGCRRRDPEIVSSGCSALDRLLPRGGFQRGGLVEWLSPSAGCGAGTLAWIAARQACRQGGALVVLDRGQTFYPPAAFCQCGSLAPRVTSSDSRSESPTLASSDSQGESAALILLRPENPDDELWAVEQSLRCPAVAAVWGLLGEIDAQAFRRLQLAAEAAGCLGLLMRPASARGQPAWSDVQLFVEPQAAPAGGWRLQVEVVRCRGGKSGGRALLELAEDGRIHEINHHETSTHETHPLPVVAELGHAMARRRAAGA
jgi:hypothetical protein